MSYFRGCNNLVAVKLFILSLFLFFLDATAQENLFQLSTREEMVEMAGYGEEKLSNVLVIGTVVCKACLHGHAQLQAWPISGAVVAVNCHTSGRNGRSSSRTQAVTDEYGEFIVDLPSDLHATPRLDKRCSVRVVHIPKSSLCRGRNLGKQNRLKLSSVGNNIRTYTAGNIKFLHPASRPTQACISSGISDKDMAW